MNKLLKRQFTILCFIFLIGCGYAPIYSTSSNQSINIEITSYEGDTYINSVIRSRLLVHQNNENVKLFPSINKIVKEIGDYIKSTYGEHYSTTKDGFQVQDLFKTLGIGQDFCQANAIKYLCRYGKKNGHNRADLLKAVHYVILLLT